MNDRKQHYKRFFALVALFGLITSTAVYASESENSPFPNLPEPTPIKEILPDLPELVTPEDPEQDPEPEPVKDPEPKEEVIEIEEPSSGISENEVSENGISDNNTEDQEPETSESELVGSTEDPSAGSPVFIVPDNVNADNFYKTSVSLDLVKIEQLTSISQDLVSINEVIKKHEKTQKDIITIISRIDRNEQTYQKGVLEYLLSIANSLSGNKVEISSNEISISLNAAMIEDIMNSISENEPETVSSNNPEPETVSDDDIKTISDDVVSISKGDIEQLHKDNEQIHEDLKSIFYVGIFGVIFLAMIAAGNLEQIIFKRIRG